MDLADIISILGASDTETRKKIISDADAVLAKKKFIALPGPQTAAYLSKADILLFGGSPGGGKTALQCGLALNEHTRSLIVRREFVDLEGVLHTAQNIIGSNAGMTFGNRPKYKDSSRSIEFIGLGEDIGGKQGNPHDLICIDEVAQVPEFQVRMLLGWMRTNKVGQRCRMVMASNPPLDSVGDWLLDFFAPWLNPQYVNPAGEGELRYFLPRTDGFPGERECNKDDTTMIGGIEVTPLSRTFISSKFTDNPYYDAETYAKSLSGLPDSVRERLISGSFISNREDDEMQCIPTDWVRKAQERWHSQPPVGIPMCAIGVDVAVGGKDEFVIARRHDGWFANIVAVPGRQVSDGKSAAGLVMANRHDNATVIVDVGGGFGADCHGHLQKNGIDSIAYMGINTVRTRTKDGALPIFNRRSQAYWQFREALDPSQPGGSPIMLPQDNKLVADLCAPKYKVSTHGIEVESKLDVCKKLGRSTDRGDAVVMAWSSGLKQANFPGGFRVKGTTVNVITRYKRR